MDDRTRMHIMGTISWTWCAIKKNNKKHEVGKGRVFREHLAKGYGINLIKYRHINISYIQNSNLNKWSDSLQQQKCEKESCMEESI